jgi:hypothetical protein
MMNANVALKERRMTSAILVKMPAERSEMLLPNRSASVGTIEQLHSTRTFIPADVQNSAEYLGSRRGLIVVPRRFD